MWRDIIAAHHTLVDTVVDAVFKVGDLVLFKFGHQQKLQHAGIDGTIDVDDKIIGGHLSDHAAGRCRHVVELEQFL